MTHTYLRKAVFGSFVILVVALPPLASSPEVAQGATEYMVPMRDDTRLATNVFLPEGDGPWPTILVRTPYGKDGRFSQGYKRYTEAGYAYVTQDCRGKFRSEGEYRAFVDDMNDGYDTVQWVASQSFSNERVGVSGGSALGITASLAAAADPPNLVAAYVAVTRHSGFMESTFIGGVFKEADVGGWLRSQGAGDVAEQLRRRPVMDEGWKRTDLLPHHIHNIDIPIFHVGGWYDIFSQGTVTNFVYLQNRGAEGARGNQKLIMGPFGHGRLDGDLDYGEASAEARTFDKELRWFDYWLKGTPNGIMDEAPVRYYMMASARNGALSSKNGYRSSQNWPLHSKATRYYLTADHRLVDRQPSADGESFTKYTFDPAQPVPTVGGANLTLPLGPMDQRVIDEREDYLRFETEQFTEHVAVAGRIRVELWAHTDAPDTDFMIKLVDVYPDGYEALLLDSPIRARYRKGRNPEDVEMMPPGEPQLLEVDLWSTANTFEKGHRIAIHITSSNFPRFEVNSNTGESPGQENVVPRTAMNAIHHDKMHPTALVLPLLE